MLTAKGAKLAESIKKLPNSYIHCLLRVEETFLYTYIGMYPCMHTYICMYVYVYVCVYTDYGAFKATNENMLHT